MHSTARLPAAALVLAAGIITACSEPTAPGLDSGASPTIDPSIKTSTLAECTVRVAERTLTCADVRLPSQTGGVRSTIMLGSQDVFVRVTSSGTSWDAGTQILQSNVVVQNLIRQMVGTTDGATVNGVKVFFHNGPTVTSGTGTVSVANADGTDAFTGGGQPFFLYNEILQPYQISASHSWQFNVPGTVGTFVFQILISTTAPNEALPFLDKVWTGSAGTTWENASNWSSGVPDSASTVAIPPATYITSGNMPVLAANTGVTNLRVGTSSTLDLGGFWIKIWGNLDAPGAISNGLTWLSGSNSILGGNFSSVRIDASARLQRATKATGAVSITGSLSVKDQTLTIAIP